MKSLSIAAVLGWLAMVSLPAYTGSDVQPVADQAPVDPTPPDHALGNLVSTLAAVPADIAAHDRLAQTDNRNDLLRAINHAGRVTGHVKAVITGPTRVDAGDLVVLDSSSSIGSVKVAWALANSKKTFLPVDGGTRCVFASGTSADYEFFLVAAGVSAEGEIEIDIARHVVTVGQPAPPPNAPTAVIGVSPQTISVGQSATLSWSSTNATGATLNGQAIATTGSQTVRPTAGTYLYALTVSGPGGQAQATATLTVNTAPPPVFTGFAKLAFDEAQKLQAPAAGKISAIAGNFESAGARLAAGGFAGQELPSDASAKHKEKWPTATDDEKQVICALTEMSRTNRTAVGTDRDAWLPFFVAWQTKADAEVRTKDQYVAAFTDTAKGLRQLSP